MIHFCCHISDIATICIMSMNSVVNYLYLDSFQQQKQGGTLGSFIKWNFTKFIIDKNGIPVERHGPNTDPLSLVKSLEKYW